MGSHIDVGADYRDSKMNQSNINTQQDLGTWASRPRVTSTSMPRTW